MLLWISDKHAYNYRNRNINTWLNTWIFLIKWPCIAVDLDLEWVHHNLHQHLWIRQETVQVQALALYCLKNVSPKIRQAITTTQNKAIHSWGEHLTYLTEEQSIVAVQRQVKGNLVWSRLLEIHTSLEQKRSVCVYVNTVFLLHCTSSMKVMASNQIWRVSKQ